MRTSRSLALSSGLAMILLVPATAQAAAPPPMKAPARSITLSVAGLPTSAVGKVVVKGPGSCRTVVRVNGTKRLTGLRPGTYRLTAKPVQTSSGKAKATKKTRSVKVSSSKGARVLVLYVTPGTS
mgnify:FL=1